MRLLFVMTIALLLIASCKKEIKNVDSPEYLKTVKAELKDSLSETDFSALDFDGSVLSEVDSIRLYCLRVPIRGKSLKNDFLIVKTDPEGTIEKGKFIKIQGEINTNREWNGSITISSLDKKRVIQSTIVKGYITAFHSQPTDMASKAAPIYPNPYIDLPEVIVVGYTHSGGISYSDWVELQSLYYDYGSGGGGGTNTAGYYSPVGGGASGGSSGGTGGTGTTGGVHTTTTMQVDYDGQYSNPAIDLNKYLKCFTNIPDAGASCSIEILTDIPVDGDPTKFFDWSNGSPGHTFLQIRKENGSQFAMENIGFYPKTGWKTVLTPAPVDGKFVDNSGHEFNASLKININPDQLQSAINEMLYLGRFAKYDIDEYNCTDWALEVFNTARNSANQLIIPKFDLPYGEAPNGSNTPQGLYLKLQQMKKDNGPEAANVDIGFIKGYVGSGTGPCN